MSRTTTVASVGDTITPTRIDATGATFEAALDAHTAAPGIDVAPRSTAGGNERSAGPRRGLTAGH